MPVGPRSGKPSGNYFIVSRAALDAIFRFPESLDLVTAYLVLACGTGADNATTTWSERACEKYSGMSRYLAGKAIKRLIGYAEVSHHADSTRANPQYVLSHSPDPEEDPIFLPKALV